MSKIIKIKDHVELGKLKKLDAERKRLIEAVRRVLLCSNCSMKCSLCGTRVDISTNRPYSADTPFHFCITCSEEYLEYKRSMLGLESKNIPWHNQEWKKMWDAWIEYQKALRKFQNSKGVRDLFKDFKR